MLSFHKKTYKLNINNYHLNVLTDYDFSRNLFLLSKKKPRLYSSQFWHRKYGIKLFCVRIYVFTLSMDLYLQF